MNELIKITENEGKQLVSGRELYEFLEIGQDFTSWIKRMIGYGFEENVDFNLTKIREVRLEGNREVSREISEYAISINMGKEIGMLQKSEKGREIRKYFIECEKKLHEPKVKELDLIETMKLNALCWDVLKINDNSKLQLMTVVYEDNGIPTKYLPEYTPSKDSAHSATDLLKEFNVKLSAQAFNKLMIANNILEERTRTNSKKEVKKFKVLVQEQWGENLTSKHNPNETVPHYYHNKFEELLKVLEII